MTETAVIARGDWPGFSRRSIRGAAATLSLRVANPHADNTVLFNHSILTSGAIWHRQARQLAEDGWRVIVLDSRGHGASATPPAPYAMDDLVRDNIAVLDALGVARAHYVGVSQGGMTGLGLGIDHTDRIGSLCICAARADAPPAFAAGWDERIALVRAEGVDALARPTVERWFGSDVFTRHPHMAADLLACIGETSPEGFVGSAQAIQGLDYRGAVSRIACPTALIIGSRDVALLEPMRQLATVIPHSVLTEIDDAGHLPQLDQPQPFEAALLAHLHRAIAT